MHIEERHNQRVTKSDVSSAKKLLPPWPLPSPPQFSRRGMLRSEALQSAVVLNGAAATAQNFLPPLISAVWFPDSERTTATALMYEANIFGWMLCFVIPPLLVAEHGSLAEQRAGIVLLWEGCAIGGAAFFAAVMLYFPCVSHTATLWCSAADVHLIFFCRFQR